jgi:hypothetical protein
MQAMKLTEPAQNATAPADAAQAGGRPVKAMAVLAGLGMMLAGCINVQAPDKPIVIQLDINIRADVVYALSQDAANTIDENADIF